MISSVGSLLLLYQLTPGRAVLRGFVFSSNNSISRPGSHFLHWNISLLNKPQPGTRETGPEVTLVRNTRSVGRTTTVP